MHVFSPSPVSLSEKDINTGFHPYHNYSKEYVEACNFKGVDVLLEKANTSRLLGETNNNCSKSKLVHMHPSAYQKSLNMHC